VQRVDAQDGAAARAAPFGNLPVSAVASSQSQLSPKAVGTARIGSHRV